MLESHTWYRESGFPRMVRNLLIANVAVFALQMLAQVSGRSGQLLGMFSLSGMGLRAGWVWQLLTYQFLHGNLSHLLMNMFALYSLGPETERAMGARHFAALYFLSGILGGIGFVLISPNQFCLGASGAVFGVIGAFATIYPTRPVSLLFLPFVTFKAWVLAVIFGVVELLYLVQGVQGGIAHSAHLAGGIAGAIYAAVNVRGLSFTRPRRPRRSAAGTVSGEVDLAEVDRILDKVAREGIDRLTRRERATLEAASRRVPRE